MPINASPHYEKAEVEYLNAKTTEQKIRCLKKMITLAPKHKGSENLLKQLKTRLKKLKYTKEKESKKAGATQKGIRKEGHQVVIIGKTNSGKSSILNELTNAQPKISEIKFATTQPELGMLNYQSVQIQLIENPAIESEYYDKGLTNSADAILILVNKIETIKDIEEKLEKAKGKRIIAFNIKERLSENELRKISARLQSQKYNFILINTKNNFGIDELKEKIFETFEKIRVYTKEPGKEKSPKPIILNPKATIKDAAEKILKGFSEKIKETKIWGPSSKFPGQKVGLKHELKDLDVLEFKTF